MRKRMEKKEQKAHIVFEYMKFISGSRAVRRPVHHDYHLFALVVHWIPYLSVALVWFVAMRLLLSHIKPFRGFFCACARFHVAIRTNSLISLSLSLCNSIHSETDGVVQLYVECAGNIPKQKLQIIFSWLRHSGAK